MTEDGSEQSPIKTVVEYCVVCGDKASGKDFMDFLICVPRIA